MTPEEINKIAWRAGVSEEDVWFYFSLWDREPEYEWPDIILERIDGDT